MTLRGFLLPFARAFRARGWLVDAAAQGATGCAETVAAFDRVWDVRWSRNPLNPLNVLSALRRIREIVAEGRYDIVHVHTPVAAFVTRCALRHGAGGRRPVIIYTAHGFHFHPRGSRLGNFIFSTLERMAGRWTDFLVVINREDEEACRLYGLIHPDRIVYMPGIGADTASLKPESVSEGQIASLRAELGIEPGESLISMAANFYQCKRHIDAVRAFSDLNRTGVHLVFAGSGAVSRRLRRLTAQSAAAHRIHILGFRTDIPVIIRASAATILPSTREGLSRSVMESLCLGTPVLGSNIRGIRELLDGGAGILVEPQDPAGLSQAMAWIIDHPAEARAIGDRGRKRMAAFDTQKIIALHEHLYAKALGIKMEQKRAAAV
jgi:glycosyltransferase involved in cell wall biosynthesis